MPAVSYENNILIRENVESVPLKHIYYSDSDIYLDEKLYLKYKLFMEKHPASSIKYHYYLKYFKEHFKTSVDLIRFVMQLTGMLLMFYSYTNAENNLLCSKFWKRLFTHECAKNQFKTFLNTIIFLRHQKIKIIMQFWIVLISLLW